MSNIDNTNNFDNSCLQNFALGATGAVVGFEAEPIIKKMLRKSFGKRIAKEFKSIQGGGFEPYIQKAIKQNNLEKDLVVLNLNKNTEQIIRQRIGLNVKPKLNWKTKLLKHILRIPQSAEDSFKRTLMGFNAFCIPSKSIVVCNFDKFGAPVFHEIVHKLNSKSKNIIVKTLSKIRNPLAMWGTLGVSAIALLKDSKAKRKEPENGFQKATNFVKDNCGLCATAAMLPLTIEEFIANIKGTKIAKKAGVTGELLKKVKKAHKISMISYGSFAIITGLSVFLASKLRDLICSKKVNNAN